MDITVINKYKLLTLIGCSKDAYYYPPTHHLAHVRSNGEVFWIPPVNIETHCELDMSDFPFDEHICKVVFGSWVYSILEVRICYSETLLN